MAEEPEWRYDEARGNLGWIIVDEDDKPVCIVPTEARRDRILLDHKKAELADGLRETIRRIEADGYPPTDRDSASMITSFKKHYDELVKGD